jgi:hypothetical protein
VRSCSARDIEEENQRIEIMTKHIRSLTVIIAILTLVSTAAVVCEVLRR